MKNSKTFVSISLREDTLSNILFGDEDFVFTMFQFPLGKIPYLTQEHLKMFIASLNAFQFPLGKIPYLTILAIKTVQIKKRESFNSP